MPTGPDRTGPCGKLSGCEQEAVVGTGVSQLILVLFDWGGHHSAPVGMPAQACHGLCFILREARGLGFCMKFSNF